jgi:phosphotransferase system HPr (HPr) family protein
VQAGLGSDLDTVYREAVNSLRAKIAQLTDDNAVDQIEEDPSTQVAPQLSGETSEVTLTVPSEQGLHARPAALFVKTINSYDATVMVKNISENKGPVEANSLISVMLIAARKGDQVHISAEGLQKDEVITALVNLFERNFDE